MTSFLKGAVAPRSLGLSFVAVVVSFFGAAVVLSAQSGGDAARGKSAYEATCGGCHSIASNRIGPRHRGVVGRKAGSEAGYAYSPALKEAGFTWTAARLDKWLTNPRAMVPGTKMAVQVADPQRRADIIAYLETQ